MYSAKRFSRNAVATTSVCREDHALPRSAYRSRASGTLRSSRRILRCHVGGVVRGSHSRHVAVNWQVATASRVGPRALIPPGLRWQSSQPNRTRVWFGLATTAYAGSG